MENKKQTKMPDDKITGRLLVTGDLHGDTAALVMIAKRMLEGDGVILGSDPMSPESFIGEIVSVVTVQGYIPSATVPSRGTWYTTSPRFRPPARRK